MCFVVENSNILDRSSVLSYVSLTMQNIPLDCIILLPKSVSQHDMPVAKHV